MTQSIAEMTLAAQLRTAGIPFEQEYRFARMLGRQWRSDFYVHDGRLGVNALLVEVDGGGFIAGRHTRGTGFEADAEKASAAAILGYRVIRATPRQVEDGRALSWIRQALGLEVAA